MENPQLDIYVFPIPQYVGFPEDTDGCYRAGCYRWFYLNGLKPHVEEIIGWLVVWNIFYFPIYWVSNHPN